MTETGKSQSAASVRLVSIAQTRSQRYTDEQVAQLNRRLDHLAVTRDDDEHRKSNLRYAERLTFILLSVLLAMLLDSSPLPHVLVLFVSAVPDAARECIERARQL